MAARIDDREVLRSFLLHFILNKCLCLSEVIIEVQINVILYFCIKCYETIFPFHNLNKAEFSEIHSNEGKSSLSNFLRMFDDNLCDFSNNYITPEKFHKQYATSTNDDFFMLHINTRSLNKHFEKLEEFVTQLGKLPENNSNI